MTSIINGLNFRRNFYGGESAVKVDVEEILRLRRARLLEREGEGGEEVAVRALSEIKTTSSLSQNRLKRAPCLPSCVCWHSNVQNLSGILQDNMESGGCGEINIFNKITINRFCSFLKQNKEIDSFFDPVTRDMFFKNDSVNRLIYEMSQKECTDLMDEDKIKSVSSDKWNVLKQYFDYFTTHCNNYLLNLLSTQCRKSIASVNINEFDLASLHSLQVTDPLKVNDKRPIVYIIRCRCSIDYLLVPLLFKEMGMDQPVCIVGESPLVLDMRSVLSRIGYLVVQKENQLKYPELHSFMVEKKISMILEAKKSICLVLNNSLNTYISSSGEKTEIQVLNSVVNSYVDGKLKDPIIVPLSLCHEYIPKKFLPGSQSSWFSNSFTLFRMMSSQFGIAKLSICKPIYYSQCMSAPDSSGIAAVTDQKTKISNLIKHFSWFHTESQLVMPTNLVAFLILYYYKDSTLISVEDMAFVAVDFIQSILPADTLAFKESSMLTIIRRGCNILSHLLTVSADRNNKSKFNVSFDYGDYSKMLEMDVYADAVVHQILMKAVAATSFTSVTQFTPSMQYVNQVSVTSDNMHDGISNITKLLLSKHFQFVLPCKSLDDEIIKVNDWWNEAMITSARATDFMTIENDYNNREYKKSNDTQYWRADVYDDNIRKKIMLLSNCLAPRLEALSFIVTELMLNRQIGYDSMTLCSELYKNFVESVKKAAKLNRIRFRSCLKAEYFVSALITLNVHEIVHVMDLSTRSWMVLKDDVDLLSPRYAVLDSEYYNLNNWKTFIDMALVAS